MTVLFLLFQPFSVLAMTPMEYFNSLVAGAYEPGFQDGAFDEAHFNTPIGLAFDAEGNRLFVADQQNHRIRVVYLYENHRVETLAGSSIPGDQDGSLTEATFKSPTVIATLPNDQLAVYDDVDNSIRVIDLKNKNVSTLTKPALSSGWSMVYWPKDNSLYLSNPPQGYLQRVDLKTKQASIVLTKDPQLLEPRALCVYKDQLFVSDGKTSAVYQVEPIYNTLSAVNSVKLQLAGQGDHILAMTVSDNFLYALQAGKVPLVRILPVNKPIELATAWGFLAENDSFAYSPLLNFSDGVPIGFISSPRETRKLFISMGSYNNCVMSVKDYDFKESWGARNKSEVSKVISDFNYPDKKPPKTFRILITGNSMLVTAPLAFSDKDAAGHDGSSYMSHTFAKQMEFLLNLQASLKGVSEHYEVLTLGHPGRSVVFFSNPEIPDLVKQYDVDMVIAFITPEQEEEFNNWYCQPLTSEGIPTGSNAPDPEFLLKPLSERMPLGAAGDLFENAKKRGLARVNAYNQIEFSGSFQGLLSTKDEKIRTDLLEMLGKPLKVFSDKLKLSRTSEGKTPQFLVCFMPNDGAGPLSWFESFWTEICTRNNLSLVDFSKPFGDLKIQFFPTMEACCHQHFTAYGSSLVAYLLNYYLLEQHWIPFEVDSSQKSKK
jgi:DNA-binding beta-propeller fold protein YncE